MNEFDAKVEEARKGFYGSVRNNDLPGALEVLKEFIRKDALGIDKGATSETKLNAADFIHEALFLMGSHPDKKEMDAYAETLHKETGESLDDCKNRAMIMLSPSVKAKIQKTIESAYQERIQQMTKYMLSEEEMAEANSLKEPKAGKWTVTSL